MKNIRIGLEILLVVGFWFLVVRSKLLETNVLKSITDASDVLNTIVHYPMLTSTSTKKAVP